MPTLLLSKKEGVLQGILVLVAETREEREIVDRGVPVGKGEGERVRDSIVVAERVVYLANETLPASQKLPAGASSAL